MGDQKWLKRNTTSLRGKTIAVTGTTGGLGRPLCRYLAALGANLILVDRNEARSHTFRSELEAEFKTISICNINADLEDIHSVRRAVDALSEHPLDFLILNAGAYSIPRRICSTGYDNLFQINFISPYYMIRRLLPHLAKTHGRVIAVGSIAHRYSKSDPDNPDFSNKRNALSYGNAKRHLMYALYELSKKEPALSLSVVHPGITLTGITAHYPKWIYRIIKYPMKILFMSPKKASLSLLKGVFEEAGARQWIGPWIFGIWGMPQRKSLSSCSPAEQEEIGKTADQIYLELQKKEGVYLQ